jgi:hypothetical protein
MNFDASGVISHGTWVLPRSSSLLGWLTKVRDSIH